MRNLRKILMICLLVVVTISFCACSSVRTMTVTNADGTIDELVYISLDTQALIDAGYDNLDIESMQTDITTTAMREASNIVDNFKQSIDDLLTFNFTMDFKTRTDLLNIRDGLEVVTSSWQDNTYVIGLRFSDINVYRYYYNITEEAEVQPTNEEHFLYTKVIYSGLNMYVNYSDLYLKLNQEFSAKYPEFIENENELLYTYVTESRREHSDADYVTYMDGKYYHTWVVDSENIAEPITLYYNIANRGNCILLCIGISILVCGVLLIIGLIVDKHKKKKQIIIEE